MRLLRSLQLTPLIVVYSFLVVVRVKGGLQLVVLLRLGIVALLVLLDLLLVGLGPVAVGLVESLLLLVAFELGCALLASTAVAQDIRVQVVLPSVVVPQVVDVHLLLLHRLELRVISQLKHLRLQLGLLLLERVHLDLSLLVSLCL